MSKAKEYLDIVAQDAEGFVGKGGRSSGRTSMAKPRKMYPFVK